MRAVFHAPARMTAAVEAPRAVSSEARPTRPLVRGEPGGDARRPAAAAVKRRPSCWGVRPPKTRVVGVDVGGLQRADGRGGGGLEVADVGGGALLVGLRAAHGQEDRARGRGGRDVAPLERGGFAAAQRALEEDGGQGLVDARLRRAAMRADSRPRPVSRRWSAVARMAAKASAQERRGLPPAAVGAVAPEPGQHAIGERAADRVAW